MATITAANASKISSLPKSQGRQALLHALDWPPFDEEKYMRKSIHLDFLYDSLMFVVEKGFSWDKSASVVMFADRILNQIKKCDNITEILGFYNGCSQTILDSLGERDFKIFTSYIFETVLPHFKIYKYVFTNDRQEQIPNVRLLVEPPFETGQLKDTKTVNVYEYERQLQALEEKENERKMARITEKEEKLSELEDQTKQTVRSSVEETQDMNKDSVSNIIQEVMKSFSLAATENLKMDIEGFREDLEFKLEKTCLPRPQALGPPPRYSVPQQTLKASPSAKGVKSPKSPKPGSNTSLKGKRKSRADL